MQFKRYTPAAFLQPFVDAFLTIESEQGMESRVLPDTSVVMAFRYKGSVVYRENALPVSVISGLRKSPRLLGYARETGNLLVVFKPGGAAAFFKEPLHELFDASIALENLILPGELSEVEDRLASAETNPQRILIIEQFLFARFREARPDQLVLHALDRIKSANGGLRIKDLITELNISRDPFEKRFRRAIGTSPKQFSTIVRLRNLIATFPQAENLTDAAHTAGYFDQAHFIKDFTSFTGQAPKAFFKKASFW